MLKLLRVKVNVAFLYFYKQSAHRTQTALFFCSLSHFVLYLKIVFSVLFPFSHSLSRAFPIFRVSVCAEKKRAQVLATTHNSMQIGRSAYSLLNSHSVLRPLCSRARRVCGFSRFPPVSFKFFAVVIAACQTNFFNPKNKVIFSIKLSTICKLISRVRQLK